MHKSYQSVLPTTNKFLKKRWDETYYNEHRRRVQDIVPVVDTKPPQTYMHLHLKLKKLQIEEERLATIERDNRILLEKMSYIMRTRGRIDNRNNYEYRSLNREKRRRELLRVTKENQEILKRIQAREPEYDHIKWEEDWQEKLKFMDSISAYPPEWWKMSNPRQSGRLTGRSRTDSQEAETNQSQEKEQVEEKNEEKQSEEPGEQEQKEVETA